MFSVKGGLCQKTNIVVIFLLVFLSFLCAIFATGPDPSNKQFNNRNLNVDTQWDTGLREIIHENKKKNLRKITQYL